MALQPQVPVPLGSPSWEQLPNFLETKKKQLPQAQKQHLSPPHPQVPLRPALLGQWAEIGARFVCLPGQVTKKPGIVGGGMGKRRFKE